MRKPLLAALAVLACAAPLAGLPATELFPVEPGRNTERGFAVAVDGDWLAMSAPRDDDKKENAGAVYLFHWSGTTWDQRAKLFADPPRPNAQLGLALALRNGVLAAGAPGEGAVYVFVEDDGVWHQERRLTGAGHGAGTFGRSLALDAERLAVGAVGVDGATDGAVYLYKVDSWALDQQAPVHPRLRQAGERFGAAVSLAGGTLAVGAPGADAGAVYVFQRGPVRWRERAKVVPADGGAGQQYGFAVATDGAQIFAGAPTADFPGTNSGAVYKLTPGAGGWTSQRLEIAAVKGDQLGASLALDGDLLVVGAPAPPPGSGTGRVHVLLLGDSLEIPAPRNAEIRDLAGFAVAVDGGRVVVGGALGDQADGAAGAAWSFDCTGEEGCLEEAEAVARNPRSGPRFGGSVALTADLMVVGEPDGGSVSLYRQAGRSGWRQEAWLISPYAEDGFGSSVALGSLLSDSLLAVGAPLPRFSSVSGAPEEFPDGSVDLFVRRGSSWVFEATLAPPPLISVELAFDETPVAFGTSVAIADGVVAGGAGSAYVSAHEGQGWTEPRVLLGQPGGRDVVINPPEIGASVSLGDGFLAIGAPGFHDDLGAVYVLQGAGTSWGQPIQLSALARRRFGSSVALLGDRLVVGAPGTGGTDPEGNDLDRAVVFERRNGVWVVVADLDALQPPHGDEFGAAVALSKDFFVVTSPGPARGDRVTVFALPDAPGDLP